jgi:hypothetical protein
MTLFVGRGRELCRLRTLLDAKRNIVLTGTFGSGRTALVRRLAESSAGAYHFVFLTGNETRREIDHQIRTAASRFSGRVVGVLDDVAVVTSPRLRFLREQVRADHASWLVIVERTVNVAALGRLRAALGAAVLVRLGPLSQGATERWVAEWVRTRKLDWDATEVRAFARAAHGYPLALRLSLDAAVRAHRDTTAGEVDL